MSSPVSSAQGWAALIPVKLIPIAKSRLGPLGSTTRQRLATAFALDTVSASLACPHVIRTIVVTNDASAELFRGIGADVVPDVPDAGLNPALAYAAEQIRTERPRISIAALSSDLPSLTPEALAVVFESATTPRWFVPDAHQTGTTVLGSAEGSDWQPAFGTDSRQRHRALGIDELIGPGLERVRRDVDTVEDLWDARRLGVGRHTAAVLASLDVDSLGRARRQRSGA